MIEFNVGTRVKCSESVGNNKLRHQIGVIKKPRHPEEPDEYYTLVEFTKAVKGHDGDVFSSLEGSCWWVLTHSLTLITGAREQLE